jgi:hypothetical protein
LATELDHLEQEVPKENSKEAQRYIAHHLRTLRRSSTWLRLDSATVKRLDDICRKKRIVRDAFFNRLIYCLLAPRRMLESLFEFGEVEYRRVAQQWNLPTDDEAWQLLRFVPELVTDPFWFIRACLGASKDNEATLYGTYFPENLLGDPKKKLKAGEKPAPSTVVFNVFLPDELVPSHPAHKAMLDALGIELDDLLKN